MAIFLTAGRRMRVMAKRRFPTLWMDLSRRGGATDLPIETVRIVATLLLVSYHVIGSGEAAGLEIGYPHPARIFGDLLRDLRMPLFAFLAGLVFALKPLETRDLPRFLKGKLRRLLLPGAAAIVLTAVASEIVGGQGRFDGPVWHIMIFPYMHYWFLMSILLIFAIYAPIDAVTKGAALVPALGFAVAVSLAPWSPRLDVFSASGAIYLLPYFLLGVVFHRGRTQIEGWFTPVMLMAALAVIVSLAMQLSALAATGEIPGDRRDLQSLAMGFGVCLLAISLLPRSRLLDRFGPYSFTIYLYHVFGLAAARMLLAALGIDGIGFNLVFGILCGFGLPVLLHLVAERFAATRFLLLGLRPGRSSSSAGPAEKGGRGDIVRPRVTRDAAGTRTLQGETG